MSEKMESSFAILMEQIHAEAQIHYGDHEVGMYVLQERLVSIIQKHSNACLHSTEAISFVSDLHTNELYLTTACAQGRESAWNCFNKKFKTYIHSLCSFVSPNNVAAHDLASTVLGDLFLPDSSGKSRIGSYDGRSSLETWLRVIINHRATNERKRKFNCAEGLGELPEVAAEFSICDIEKAYRTKRYGLAIKDSFECACKKLTERERLILLLRYDQQLNLGQIARLLNVHQSTVTRHIEQVFKKVREEVILVLMLKHGLTLLGAEECLADITNNPEYCIISLIKG